MRLSRTHNEISNKQKQLQHYRVHIGVHKSGMGIQRSFVILPLIWMRQVPCNYREHSDSATTCFLHSLLKSGRGLPSQLLQLLPVDRVAEIVKLAVAHEHHVVLHLSLLLHQLPHLLRHVAHAHLALSSNVVELERLALVENQVERLGDILHIQEGAKILSSTVNGPMPNKPQANEHGTISLHEVDELGNHLLGILMRTVHVVGARNDHRKMVGMLVALHNELGSSLRRGVGIRRVQQGVLLDVLLRMSRNSKHYLVLSLLSIDLIRAHVNKTLDSVHAASFEKNVSANDVVVGKRQTVTERVVLASLGSEARTHMALRSKVENGINLLRFENIANETGAEDIPLFLILFCRSHFNKTVVRQILHFIQVLQRCAIIQAIHVHNLVVGVLLCQQNHNMGSARGVKHGTLPYMNPAPPVIKIFFGT